MSGKPIVRTTPRMIGVLLAGTTALALAAGSAWAGTPAPVATLEVAGGAVTSPGTAVGSVLRAGAQVSFVVDLAFRDEAGAEATAIAAATPGSPTYGHFLSSSQFDARFGPRPADVTALRTWLTRSGLTVDSDVGDQALLVHGGAARVATAFGGVSLHSATAGGTTANPRVGVLATGVLRMPAALARAVDGIGGLGGPVPAATTSSFVANNHPEVTSSAAVTATSNPPCATWFGQVGPGVPTPYPVRAVLASAPECSRFPGNGAYYTAANTTKLRTLDHFDPRYLGRGKTVGVVLWGNDGNAKRAANVQARLNGVAALRGGQYATVLTKTKTSGCSPVTPDVYLEQNLDIQATRVMAPSANIRYYADTRCQEPELSLARAVAEDKAQVLTNSWGYANYEYNPHNPNSSLYALGSIVHKALVKAAAEGITVLFATGDSGSGVLAGKAHASPGYPSSDPFAVAVGGVGFGTNAAGAPAFRTGWTDGEFVYLNRRWTRVGSAQAFGANGIGSSGGASHYWAAPAWQKRAGIGYRGKRVVPDIANAAGGEFDPFLVVEIGSGVIAPLAVGGTSVAAPLTAGQVAGALVAEHRARLGLITPALYARRRGGVVSDVTFRQDVVGGLDDLGQQVLYAEELPGESLRTRPGWDNVTGLGTPGPRFYKLLG